MEQETEPNKMIDCLGYRTLYEQKEIIMKPYKVIYKETLIHTFYVEANSEEEAARVFLEGCANCQFDFSDGEVDDSDYTIEESDDVHHYHYKREEE